MKPQPISHSDQGRWIGAAVAAAVLLASSVASADPNGVKFGDGRLHPFFDFESRYDSASAMVLKPEAVEKKAPTPADYDTPGDMVLHFRPGLKLEVPSPAFAVSLAGQLDYNLFLGAINSGTRSASFLAADADLNLGFNKEGQVSFDLGDHVTRSDQVMVPSIKVGALSLYNDASAKLSIKPSGGALSFEPSYHFTSEFFTEIGAVKPAGCEAGDSTCDPSTGLKVYDYLNHTFDLTGSWRFLPKTAFLVDATYGVRTYTDTRSIDINTLKLQAGIAGLLTTHVSTLLKAGWGWDTTKHTYSSMVAQAEFAYLLSETGSIRLGYVRTFEPIGGGFQSYRDDRPYLEMQLLLGGKFTLHARATYDALTYRGYDKSDLEHPDQLKTMKQSAVGGELGGDYELAPWLDLGAGIVSSYRASADGKPIVLSYPTFKRNEFFLHVKATY